MSRHLLDANALIALTLKEHVHFDRASAWFATISHAALCPIVEGALVRYLVRVGVPVTTVRSLLTALYEDPRIEFWADEISYADIGMGRVVGHRQVTDTYLAALAAHKGAQLATLDRALSEALPSSTLLIPEA